MAYFLVSAAILAAALFFPVSRLIWVLSVRRFERKTQRKLSETEIAGQRRRARLIAAFLVIVFSLLFANALIGIPGRG